MVVGMPCQQQQKLGSPAAAAAYDAIIPECLSPPQPRPSSRQPVQYAASVAKSSSSSSSSLIDTSMITHSSVNRPNDNDNRLKTTDDSSVSSVDNNCCANKSTAYDGNNSKEDSSSQSLINGRVKLRDVNPYLVCVLCHGYFVDATSIAECLHSFCRSCIILYLETKNFCPICEVHFNNSKPHLILKPDKTLQDIVYKLVPGLFHSEMKRRLEFYQNRQDRDLHLHPEFRGITVDRLVYSPEDKICFSLEYYDDDREKEEWRLVGAHRAIYSHLTSPTKLKNEASGEKCDENNASKKYLTCPAAVRITSLKKLIRLKYNLHSPDMIEMFYRRESLPDDYSLMDIAYIYTWKRNCPMRLYYRIHLPVNLTYEEKVLAVAKEISTLPTPSCSSSISSSYLSPLCVSGRPSAKRSSSSSSSSSTADKFDNNNSTTKIRVQQRHANRLKKLPRWRVNSIISESYLSAPNRVNIERSVKTKTSNNNSTRILVSSRPPKESENVVEDVASDRREDHSMNIAAVVDHRINDTSEVTTTNVITLNSTLTDTIPLAITTTTTTTTTSTTTAIATIDSVANSTVVNNIPITVPCTIDGVCSVPPESIINIVASAARADAKTNTNLIIECDNNGNNNDGEFKNNARHRNNQENIVPEKKLDDNRTKIVVETDNKQKTNESASSTLQLSNEVIKTKALSSGTTKPSLAAIASLTATPPSLTTTPSLTATPSLTTAPSLTATLSLTTTPSLTTVVSCAISSTTTLHSVTTTAFLTSPTAVVTSSPTTIAAAESSKTTLPSSSWTLNRPILDTVDKVSLPVTTVINWQSENKEANQIPSRNTSKNVTTVSSTESFIMSTVATTGGDRTKKIASVMAEKQLPPSAQKEQLSPENSACSLRPCDGAAAADSNEKAVVVGSNKPEKPPVPQLRALIPMVGGGDNKKLLNSTSSYLSTSQITLSRSKLSKSPIGDHIESAAANNKTTMNAKVNPSALLSSGDTRYISSSPLFCGGSITKCENTDDDNLPTTTTSTKDEQIKKSDGKFSSKMANLKNFIISQTSVGIKASSKKESSADNNQTASRTVINNNNNKKIVSSYLLNRTNNNQSYNNTSNRNKNMINKREDLSIIQKSSSPMMNHVVLKKPTRPDISPEVFITINDTTANSTSSSSTTNGCNGNKKTVTALAFNNNNNNTSVKTIPVSSGESHFSFCKVLQSSPIKNNRRDNCSSEKPDSSSSNSAPNKINTLLFPIMKNSTTSIGPGGKFNCTLSNNNNNHDTNNLKYLRLNTTIADSKGHHKRQLSCSPNVDGGGVKKFCNESITDNVNPFSNKLKISSTTDTVNKISRTASDHDDSHDDDNNNLKIGKLSVGRKNINSSSSNRSYSSHHPKEMNSRAVPALIEINPSSPYSGANRLSIPKNQIGTKTSSTQIKLSKSSPVAGDGGDTIICPALESNGFSSNTNNNNVLDLSSPTGKLPILTSPKKTNSTADNTTTSSVLQLLLTSTTTVTTSTFTSTTNAANTKTSPVTATSSVVTVVAADVIVNTTKKTSRVSPAGINNSDKQQHNSKISPVGFSSHPLSPSYHRQSFHPYLSSPIKNGASTAAATIGNLSTGSFINNKQRFPPGNYSSLIADVYASSPAALQQHLELQSMMTLQAMKSYTPTTNTLASNSAVVTSCNIFSTAIGNSKPITTIVNAVSNTSSTAVSNNNHMNSPRTTTRLSPTSPMSNATSMTVAAAANATTGAKDDKAMDELFFWYMMRAAQTGALPPHPMMFSHAAISSNNTVAGNSSSSRSHYPAVVAQHPLFSSTSSSSSSDSIVTTTASSAFSPNKRKK